MSGWGSVGEVPPNQPANPKSSLGEPKQVAIRLIKLGVQAVGWIILLGGIFLALSVLLGVTKPLVLLVFQGMLPVFFPLIVLVLVISVVTKKWGLGAISLMLTVSYMLLVLPAVTKDSTPKWSEEGGEFSLFVGNVSFRNPTPNSIARAVTLSRADVVVLNEVSDTQFQLLSDAGLFDTYTTVERVRQGAKTSELVMTSEPVLSSGVENVGSQQLPFVEIMVIDDRRGSVGRPVKIFAIHAQAPSKPDLVDRWESDLEELGELADSEDPIVLAGDFNSTLWHRPLRDLIDSGFKDSHDFMGDGLSRSWGPNWTKAAPFGAIMRLDHALTFGEIVPSEIGNRDIQGSDHIAFRVEFRVDT